MRPLTNINARSFTEAVTAANAASAAGQAFAFSGGGTDLLQQVKDGTVSADVLINLRTIADGATLTHSATESVLGGLATLTELAADPVVTQRLTALSEAAASVATPQIRNVATLAGNITQRPWCWYYRNGFACYKAGGDRCYSVNGENQQHAIFGGGPSFIVHPSDTAPALVALAATFEVTGPAGSRRIPVAEFFVLPGVNAAQENVLQSGELLTGVRIPALPASAASTYFKVTDREAWTHAEVSVAAVLHLEGATVTEARIVLGGVAPIPWRVPAVENLLRGKALTPALAQEAGALAIAGAQPLAKNRHKLPMTSAAVERTLRRFIPA